MNQSESSEVHWGLGEIQQQVGEILNKNLIKGISIFLLAIMLFFSIIFVIKLGYQLTMITLKLIFMIIVSVIETSIIISLLYPTKWIHKIIIILEYLIKHIVISFLERRRSKSICATILSGAIKTSLDHLIRVFNKKNENSNDKLKQYYLDDVHIN